VTWEEIKLQVDEKGKRLMEERHISEDEVKQVIHRAETEGEKLYLPDENRYLAKLLIGTATFYVEYSIEDGNYIVRTVYAHKADIKG